MKEKPFLSAEVAATILKSGEQQFAACFFSRA